MFLGRSSSLQLWQSSSHYLVNYQQVAGDDRTVIWYLINIVIHDAFNKLGLKLSNEMKWFHCMARMPPLIIFHKSIAIQWFTFIVHSPGIQHVLLDTIIVKYTSVYWIESLPCADFETHWHSCIVLDFLTKLHQTVQGIISAVTCWKEREKNNDYRICFLTTIAVV